MSTINVSKMRANNVPGVFDSNICGIALRIPWHWPDRDYWWYYAEHPDIYEWKIVGDLLQVNINGHWTVATWIGTERYEWVMIRRFSDHVDMNLAVLNGRIIEKAWNQDDIRRDRHDYMAKQMQFRAISNRLQKIPGQGGKNMPDFTEEQLVELHAKHDARYLEAAEKWAAGNNIPYWRSVMDAVAERLSEIGFETPEHEFRREPIEVPVWRVGGAVFVTNPESHHQEGYCECANCDHKQEDYENEDRCSCENCMENLDHWHHNGRDPTHCNFCAEHKAHLDASAPKKEE